MPDLNATDIESAMSMVAGTCRSMGVTVERLIGSKYAPGRLLSAAHTWEDLFRITTMRRKQHCLEARNIKTAPS
jgi:hypothetical protein